MESYLVLDIGTSSLKAGIVNSEGRLFQHFRVSYNANLIEQHDKWISAFRTICEDIENITAIDAICISGNGPTLSAVSDGKILNGGTLMWNSPTAPRIQGTRSLYLDRLAGLKELNPRVYADADVFLSPPELLLYLLCGTATAYSPWDAFDSVMWSVDEIKAYSLDAGKLPDFSRPGKGHIVNSAGSALFGFKTGTEVYCGGADFFMSLLGTNTTKPGRVCDRAGTSEGVNICIPHEMQLKGLRTLPHIIPGLYNLAGILSSTGTLFEWFRNLSGQLHVPYSEMLDTISKLSDNDLPYFFPSIDAQNMWEFANGGFVNLGPRHSREHMGRAVVLSIGFAVKDYLQRLQESGYQISTMVVTGGQARNNIWNQMKADITGVTLEIPEILDAELVGNLQVIRFGRKSVASIGEDITSISHIKNTYIPDADRAEYFDIQYTEYKRQLKNISNRNIPED